MIDEIEKIRVEMVKYFKDGIASGKQFFGLNDMKKYFGLSGKRIGVNLNKLKDEMNGLSIVRWSSTVYNSTYKVELIK